MHAMPESKKGFFMVDRELALVEECRTSTDEAGSVCGIANDCYEGHEGLICGNCMREYTRDAFPAPCEPCAAMPETSVLVLQLITDLTVAGLWNQFNMSKVEKMDWGGKTDEDEPANATEPVEEEEGMGWPPWYGEMAQKLTFLQEAAPRVGSVQMVIECIIDREYVGSAKDATTWKLVGPAIYWVSYPLLMVG